MPIAVERHCDRGVTQHGLDGFGVGARLDRQAGRGVPEIMGTGGEARGSVLPLTRGATLAAASLSGEAAPCPARRRSTHPAPVERPEVRRKGICHHGGEWDSTVSSSLRESHDDLTIDL
jgi:hypothetical protein